VQVVGASGLVVHANLNPGARSRESRVQTNHSYVVQSFVVQSNHTQKPGAN